MRREKAARVVSGFRVLCQHWQQQIDVVTRQLLLGDELPQMFSVERRFLGAQQDVFPLLHLLLEMNLGVQTGGDDIR